MYNPKRSVPTAEAAAISGVYSINDATKLRSKWRWPWEHGFIAFGPNNHQVLTNRALGEGKSSGAASVIWPSYAAYEHQFTDVAANDGTSSLNVGFIGLTVNGRILNWGYTSGLGRTGTTSIPTQPGDASFRYISVAAGSEWGAAVRDDGTLWSWGTATGYRNGFTTTTARSVPAQVGTDTDWAKVAGCRDFGAAVKTDGRLFSWGLNTTAQTGQNTTAGSTIGPVQVPGTTTFRDAFCTAGRMFAISTDGFLFSCGNNTSGATGQGLSTGTTMVLTQIGTKNDWKKVAFQPSATVAITSTGELWHTGIASNVINASGTRTTMGRMGPDTDWYDVGPAGTGFFASKNNGEVYYFGKSSSDTPNGQYSSSDTNVPYFIGQFPAGVKIQSTSASGWGGTIFYY